MRPRSFTVLFFTVLACGSLPECAWTQDYPKLAPYPSIHWAPEVWIEGQWYALRSIDDLPVEKILAFARSKYESNWDKRFGEDLVQLLSEMGHTPGKTVKLVVRDLKIGT